jgi:putative oxidoreductase
MTVSNRLARPMLAGMFIVGGLDAVRDPASKEHLAKDVAPGIAEPLGLPTDPVKLVRINGAVQLVAGTLLAFGKLPRLSAAALAVSLVPTTAAAHRFWEQTDKQQKKQQKIQFLKNVGLLGGLIFAANDRGGRPSLTWRARRAARKASKAAARVTHDVAQLAQDAAQGATSVVQRVAS